MARSKDACTGEARSATNHMDHTTASEVVKAFALVIGIAEPAPTPGPTHYHWVNQASHQA